MSAQQHRIELLRSIEAVIQANTDLMAHATTQRGVEARIVNCRNVSGGCISQAEIITLEDGRRFFVKSNLENSGLFTAETAGLEAIRLTHSIRVPDIIGHSHSSSGTGFIVLETIETGTRGGQFEEQFARSLAKMHQSGSSQRFGFRSDNYLGSSPQINQWESSWVDFFADQRLGFQHSLAVKNGLSTPEFSRLLERLISKLDSLLINPEKPSLIHGDLWSGNFMVSPEGLPVLIDPAAYFGSREAEFGMTTLFGGFSARFYEAYNESWPMQDGWQERVEIYRLYHLLNHLNLFGTGYLGQCLEILKKYA